MKYLCCCLFFVSFTSRAQENIISFKGRLTDYKSKEAIPFASIYIKGKTLGTTSNEEGDFIFHVPLSSSNDVLVASAIGYEQFTSSVMELVNRDNQIVLKPSVILLKEVVVKAEKELSAKEIVKKAVAAIAVNYPMKPFAIEGFFRDLQFENEKPVELLEAATRFIYEDYNPGFEEVQVVEVRRSFNQRHPVNGTYDRQNSIIDLMEDNYIKHRFGPIKVKGWKFELDSVLTYDSRTVYKISGASDPSESTVMYIDAESFAIRKLELWNKMVEGKFYRRYLNLPDPYGLQETSFHILFEFREFEGKMYLKYQREDDTYNLFIKATNEIVIRQAFIKELFVNNIITDKLAGVKDQMNINKSVESQAKPFNASFWKYYNIPVETSRDSQIIKILAGSELKK